MTEQGIKVGDPEAFGLNIPILVIDDQSTKARHQVLQQFVRALLEPN